MAFKRTAVRSRSPPLGIRSLTDRPVPDSDPEHAGIAQLVEHNLAKVGVAGSNPVSRSKIT